MALGADPLELCPWRIIGYVSEGDTYDTQGTSPRNRLRPFHWLYRLGSSLVIQALGVTR